MKQQINTNDILQKDIKIKNVCTNCKPQTCKSEDIANDKADQ